MPASVPWTDGRDQTAHRQAERLLRQANGEDQDPRLKYLKKRVADARLGGGRQGWRKAEPGSGCRRPCVVPARRLIRSCRGTASCPPRLCYTGPPPASRLAQDPTGGTAYPVAGAWRATRLTVGTPMLVTFELDEENRRFVITAASGADRAEILGTVAEAVRCHPAIASWDCIADLRHPLAGDRAFDLSSLAPLFDREEERPALTVLLTDQSRMMDWVRLLNHQFKSRRFCVAASPREALHLIEGVHPRYDR